MLVDRLRLVELPLALEVEGQVVQVVHHRAVERYLAEFVKRHVELALALERQAQHTIGLRGFDIRLLLAGFGDDITLGGQEQMPNQQKRGRHHQLDPHAGRYHQREVGRHQRDQDAQGDQRRRPRLQFRQQGDQIGGDQQENQQFQPNRPGRGHKEMLGQNRRHGVGGDFDRRQGRRHRCHEAGADTGSGCPDQHDFAGIALGGVDLAGDHVVKRVDLKRPLVAAILVEKSEHPRTGIGGDRQLAQAQLLAPDDLDVIDPEVERLRRHHQGERGHVTVVVLQQQRLGANRAIRILGLGQVAEPRRHRTQTLDRKLDLVGGDDIGALLVNQGELGDEGRQVLVGLAARLPHRQIGRKHHVIGGGETGSELAIGVQCCIGFLQKRAELGEIDARGGRVSAAGVGRSGRRHRLVIGRQQLVDVDQTRVLLRFKELHAVADHLGFRTHQDIGHLGMHFAAPRPAPDVLDAFVVDRDHRDLVIRRLARRGHTPIVGFAFDTAQYLAAVWVGRDEKRQCNDQPQKPI